MKEEIGVKEILANLKKLSYHDLEMVQRWLTQVIYAKGVEDYLHDLQYGPLIEKMMSSNTEHKEG